MKLEICDWVRPHVTPVPSKFRTVAMNRRGRFIFSKAAEENFLLKEGMYIAFAKDTDSRNDWYITFQALKSNGSVIRYTHSASNHSRALITNNKEAANAILDSVKADKGASLLIAMKPVNFNGIDWHKLLTSKPIRMR